MTFTLHDVLFLLLATFAIIYFLALYTLCFVWRRTIRPLRFWLIPSAKVAIGRVFRSSL